jgi:hypothetical protein
MHLLGERYESQEKNAGRLSEFTKKPLKITAQRTGTSRNGVSVAAQQHAAHTARQADRQHCREPKAGQEDSLSGMRKSGSTAMATATSGKIHATKMPAHSDETQGTET